MRSAGPTTSPTAWRDTASGHPCASRGNGSTHNPAVMVASVRARRSSSSTGGTLGKDAPVLLLPDRGAPETEPQAWAGPRGALALSDRPREARGWVWNRRKWEPPATTSHGSTAGVRTIAGTDAIDQRR